MVHNSFQPSTVSESSVWRFACHGYRTRVSCFPQQRSSCACCSRFSLCMLARPVLQGVYTSPAVFDIVTAVVQSGQRLWEGKTKWSKSPWSFPTRTELRSHAKINHNFKATLQSYYVHIDWSHLLTTREDACKHGGKDKRLSANKRTRMNQPPLAKPSYCLPWEHERFAHARWKREIFLE
jgi:hypothetical protein